MNYIERRLKDRTETFLEGLKYYKQWELAKDYIPQVLEVISHTFPHYSMHNSMHSENILNNIIRIVGEDTIDKLSVVDLWLLLSAAYLHDCGMFVTAEDKTAILEEQPAFVRYIQEKQEDITSPMREYADLLEIKDEKIYYKNELLTAKSYDSVKFLLADFIRSQHAERSAEKISQSSSLHLPGSPIPERIIRILEKICQAHTQTHAEVMRLPFSESSGCGTEDCHPLYIACLLRLGDLLDIDSNRVSDVLLSTLSHIPADSSLYNDSNRSITHLRIDRSIVEITAVCENYAVADIMNRWFQWLNEELIFQMKNWHKIVPDNSYGYLPTVGGLNVELKGFDTFDGKNRPSFDIDTTKAIELLQGMGLYKEPSQCIRELLQNSVDATYLRIYIENQAIKDFDSFRKLCKSYPINISLRKKNIDKQYAYWEIILEDHGLGMSKEDLQYLSKTGSSSKNRSKKKIVDSMPAWMRPSGIFGIGFQSVFLITEQVEIRTRKLNKEDSFNVTLNNPAGQDSGSILFQTVRDDWTPFGTTLSFELKVPVQSGWSIKDDELNAIRVINSYDFAKDDSLDIQIAKLIDEIVRFARASFVSVNLIYNDKPSLALDQDNLSFDYYDESTGFQVALGALRHSSDIYFRNQIVRSFDPSIPLLRFSINILSDNAKDILTLSRDDIRKEYVDKLKCDACIAISNYLLKFIESFEEAKDKQLASMYLEWNRGFIEKNISSSTISFPDYWKQYELQLKSHSDNNNGTEIKMTIEQLLKAKIITYDSRPQDSILSFYVESEQYDLIEKFRIVSREIFDFICHIIGKDYHPSFGEDVITWTKDTRNDYIENTDKARKRWMKQYLNKTHYARGLMPCNKYYKELEVEKSRYESTFARFTNDYPVMICPYVRDFNQKVSLWSFPIKLEYSIDEIVIDKVYEERKNKDVTKEQIQAAYERFKNDFDNVVQEINQEKQIKDKKNNF